MLSVWRAIVLRGVPILYNLNRSSKIQLSKSRIVYQRVTRANEKPSLSVLRLARCDGCMVERLLRFEDCLPFVYFCLMLYSKLSRYVYRVSSRYFPFTTIRNIHTFVSKCVCARLICTYIYTICTRSYNWIYIILEKSEGFIEDGLI